MELVEITDFSMKKEITFNTLKALPDWFAIESAISEYVNSVSDTLFLSYKVESSHVGFISLKKHFPTSYEIYVMGVLEEYHNQGIGTRLLKEAEKILISNNISLLQVKTLSDSRPDKYYDITRNFYLNNGFLP